MARQQRDPLRALTDEERECLLLISRSYREPAAPVMRAKALLAVAAAESFTAAAARAAAPVGRSCDAEPGVRSPAARSARG
jgi:hypothetical protein